MNSSHHTTARDCSLTASPARAPPPGGRVLIYSLEQPDNSHKKKLSSRIQRANPRCDLGGKKSAPARALLVRVLSPWNKILFFFILLGRGNFFYELSTHLHFPSVR